MIRPVEALVAIVLVAGIMAVASAMTAARGDDRFPWTERPAPIAYPVDDVSSRRRRPRRIRIERPRPHKAAAVPMPPPAPAAIEPAPVEPFPFPLVLDPKPAPSRFDAAFAAVAEAPIVPKAVRTVSFRMPIKAPEKPPEPRAHVFAAALAFAAVAGLMLYASIRAIAGTKWQRLRRPAKAPPRNLVYLTVSGRKRKIA